MRHAIPLSICFSITLGLATPALADDTPPPPTPAQQDDWNKVIELGKVDVHASRDEQAKQIVAGLKVIKHALKANLSNDPADANVVVCRMNYDTGSHLTAHLMCATNRTMMVYRDQLHAAMMTGTNGQPDGAATQELEHLNGVADRHRYFSTKINASELQKLLLQVQCQGCSDSGLVVGNN
ncbi:MAG TPA: hypothetical protein VGH71_06885 [Gammaproteobacteria bacterium]|jgi:hypothetical protein